MNKKLIIWDFDDVISDSEKIWCNVWKTHLSEIGINWTLEKCIDELAGVCMKDKSKKLKLKYDIDLPNGFEKALNEDCVKSMYTEMKMIEDIDKCISLENFDHCIATGGNYEKTYLKIDILKINKFFPKEKVFSSEELEHGKPEPEIFLLPLEKLGYQKEEAIVIEDSIAGITAANRAGIDVIAFTKTKSKNDKKYFEIIDNLNTYKICDTANDLYKVLLEVI